MRNAIEVKKSTDSSDIFILSNCVVSGSVKDHPDKIQTPARLVTNEFWMSICKELGAPAELSCLCITHLILRHELGNITCLTAALPSCLP